MAPSPEAGAPKAAARGGDAGGDAGGDSGSSSLLPASAITNIKVYVDTDGNSQFDVNDQHAMVMLEVATPTDGLTIQLNGDLSFNAASTVQVFAQTGGSETALTLTLIADSQNKGVFYTSASDLVAAYETAGIAEKDLPPEALVVKVDSDGDGSVGTNEPVVTTWLQPVVTSYDASADGLTITLNGNVADATPEMIQITAQTFEAGNMMPTEMPLPAGSVTLTPDASVSGKYTVSASDLAAALQSAGAPNATALLVSVSCLLYTSPSPRDRG